MRVFSKKEDIVMGLATTSAFNQIAMLQTMNAQYGLMNGAQQMAALSNQAGAVAMNNPSLLDGPGAYAQGGYMNNLYLQERGMILAQSQRQVNLKMYEAMQESNKKLLDKQAGSVGTYLNTTA
jgi:hypothetical protein